MTSENFIMPMQWVGPIALKYDKDQRLDYVDVPLTTYETPLWPSIKRGAKITNMISGVQAIIVKDTMTRSIIMSSNSAHHLMMIYSEIKNDNKIYEIANNTSNFLKLEFWNSKILGKNIYLRFSFNTNEASGHNMCTKASDAIINYLEQKYQLSYFSISGNYCVDKKVSAINSIIGRGKEVIVEGTIPADICKKYLRTTPEVLHNLNIQKNYLGSIISGSLCSANAHYANILLAIYLATGQDAANIVEGSQGITITELVNQNLSKSLYFSVNITNIIVGVVGNGKDFKHIKNNLQRLKCLNTDVEENSNFLYTKSQRLAMIIGAAIWCGELSLLAAQSNPGELMKSHLFYERANKKQYV